MMPDCSPNETLRTNSSGKTNVTSYSASVFDPVAADQADFVAWLVITPIISFVGVFFNVLLLLVTWPHNGQKSSFGILVFQFVLINLFMCLIAIPVSVFLVQAKWDGYVLPANCKYVHGVYTTGMNAVNWSDAVLAINRCMALFLPHTYRAWARKSMNIVLITSVWILSLIRPILVLANSGAGWFLLLDLGQCIYAQAKSLGDFAASIGSFVPYFITGMGAFLMLWKACSVTQQRSAVGPNQSVAQSRATKSSAHRLAMAKMLLFTFIWSAICTLPSYLFRFLAPPLPAGVPSWLIPALWLRTAPPCQYAVTPCILMLSNARYRNRLTQIITRRHTSSATDIVELETETKL